MTKIGLYLMGLKGLISLKALIDCEDVSLRKSIVFISAAKDTSIQNDYFESIKSLAEINSLLFYEKNEVPKDIDVDIIFAISWRWILKENNKLIVFHDSLLPKYRGFNPLVTALIEGDNEIGVTAIEATEEFDKGNIISSKKINIDYPIKIVEAMTLLGDLYGNLLIDILKARKSNELTGYLQDENNASYSLWRNEDDYWIDWKQDANKIKRFIDAVGYPYKGACTNYAGKKILIIDALVKNDVNIINRDFGKFMFIENNMPVVVCGSGLLTIEKALYFENNEVVKFTKLRTKLR